MPVTLTGAVGELRAGYAVAARIVRWNLSQPDGVRWEFGGTLEDINPVYLRPERATYDLCLVVGNQLWRWRGVTPGIDGARIMWAGADEPQKSARPDAPDAGYVCLGCGKRQPPGYAGRACECGGWLVEAK